MDHTRCQAVILALMKELRDHDSWCGETHIQKSVHFLQEAMKVPLDMEFVMYKHGPFSFELREFLGELRGSQLLEVQPMPPYGPRLTPSTSGLALMKRFPQTVGHFSAEIQFVADRLGSRDVIDLERMGTALFVTQQMPSANDDERVREMMALKPRIEESSAYESLQGVADLLAEARQTMRRARRLSQNDS